MNKLQLSLAALAAAGTLSSATMAPASADSAASTRNIILGAAALAGIAIEANVAQKNARANGVSGYLADGSTVYGDGHVVDRNGNSYYPGNDGRSVSCDNGSCYIANADANANRNQNRNVDRNRRNDEARTNDRGREQNANHDRSWNGGPNRDDRNNR